MIKISKVISVAMILLAITIYYDVEAQSGWLWVNNHTSDATILAYPSVNKVVWYTSSKLVFTQTYTEFVNDHANDLLRNLQGSGIIIHKVDEKPKDGIRY